MKQQLKSEAAQEVDPMATFENDIQGVQKTKRKRKAAGSMVVEAGGEVGAKRESGTASTGAKGEFECRAVASKKQRSTNAAFSLLGSTQLLQVAGLT